MESASWMKLQSVNLIVLETQLEIYACSNVQSITSLTNLVSVDANVTRLVLVIGAVIAATAKKIFHFLVWSRLNQVVCLVARNVEIYPKLKLAFGLVTQSRPVHSCKFLKIILNQLSFLANIMVFN
jgi:hypothetical protein